MQSRCGLIIQGLMATGIMACAALAHAGDWPQILGPQRNGIAEKEFLPEVWPQKMIPAWTVPCGAGFAGVAVAEGKTVLFHRQGGEEIISVFDAASGTPVWSKSYPCDYQASIVEDDGPRAVPTIHQGRVITFGVAGRLSCLQLKDGGINWSRDTHQEFKAPAGYFGAGSAPLVEGAHVIVNVGGPNGAGVVAFDLQSGKTAWKATDELASYAAPIAHTLAGKRRVLMITRLNFLGLDPHDGREVFRIPFGARGPTVNGALPVLVADNVLLTASYGIGAKLVHLGADKVDVTWDEQVLSSQYTTPIVHEKQVYGIDGRQDGGPVSLKCFDPITRQVAWSKDGMDYATLIATGQHLFVMQTNGVLRVAELSPKAYHEVVQVKLLTGTTRALPALARGRFYIRNERSLACFDFRGAGN